MTGGLVAVLFSDVVSSTELWSTLGDARADEVRRRLNTASEDAVIAAGGMVVKDMGDGLMATFPTASASVDGAVALQQAVAGVRRWSRVPELRMRVGVSIGEANQQDDDWFGVPVVEAARLCAAAEPGQILVTDAVVLLGRRIEQVVHPLGPLSLKGLPEPVPVSEVEWLAAPASGLRVPTFLQHHSDEMPFTGREAQMTELEHANATAHEGHLLFISGEPGVGKTRLLAEFVSDAAASGSIVLGSAYEQDGDQTWRPLLAGLRALTGLHEPPPATREVLAAVVPGVDTLVRRRPVADVDAVALGEAVAGWLVSVADDAGPVIWVVDDLHWASRSALDVVRHVVPTLEEAPVLVVATYRDTDLDRTHPLAGWLADLRRHGPLTRVDLQGLSVENLTEVLAAQADEPLDAAVAHLVDGIYRETEGNAFFVSQVIDHLIETDVLVLDDGRWRVTVEPDRLGLPEGVREVVGRRLERLPDGVDEVLAVAAVQGREFTVPVICGALGRDMDHVADAIDAAESAGLIRADAAAAARFRFVHALVRETVLEELSSLRRSRLHLRVARVLDDHLPGRSAETVTRIAAHYVEAAAVGGLPRAAELIGALAGGGAANAPELLELALRALEDADDVGLEARARVWLHATIAHTAWLARNDRDLTHRSFVEAVRLTDGLDDPDLFAEAVASGANGAGFGLSTEFLELAPRALAGVEPTSRAGLMLRRSLMMSHAWYAPPGVDPAAEYMELSAEDGVPTIGAGLFLHSSPDVDRALQDISQASHSLMTHLPATWTYVRVDLRRAEEHLSTAQSLAGRREAAGIAAGLRQGEALLAIARGQLAEADLLIDEVQQLAGGEPMFAVGVPWQRAVLVRWRGDADEALAVWDSIAAFNPYHRLSAASVALAELEAGDVGAAKSGFLTAWADGPATLGRDWTYTGTLGVLAELAIGLGAQAEAHELDRILEPFDGQFLLEACISLRGSVSWLRAGLARCVGDLDEAIVRYQRAENLEAEQGAHALLARTRVDLASARAQRAGPGDRDSAEELLASAETEARRMAAGLVLRRAEATRAAI